LQLTIATVTMATPL